MKKLDTQSPDFQAELKALLAFETAQNPEIDRIVADICADVQKRGDAALINIPTVLTVHLLKPSTT